MGINLGFSRGRFNFDGSGDGYILPDSGRVIPLDRFDVSNDQFGTRHWKMLVNALFYRMACIFPCFFFFLQTDCTRIFCLFRVNLMRMDCNIILSE